MKIGDEVEWTHSVRQGKTGLKLSQRYGRIVKIEGDIATVKKRNYQQIKLPLSRLHVVGNGPNQLTQLVDNLADKN